MMILSSRTRFYLYVFLIDNQSELSKLIKAVRESLENVQLAEDASAVEGSLRN